MIGYRQLHAELLTGEAVAWRNPGPPRRRAWFNQARYEAGQSFFHTYFIQCLQSFLVTIICGFNIRRLGLPLLLTHRSDTREKALHRYVSTLRHLMLWFGGDVFAVGSPAQESLLQVNNAHAKATAMMEHHPGRFFTQYDMALVQSSFLGFVALYPGEFGVPCAEAELLGYLHFWRVIGDCLGLEERWNLCSSDDLLVVRAKLQAIVVCVVVPAIEELPADLQVLGDSFIGGFRARIPFFPFTKASVLLFALSVFKKHSSWPIIDRPQRLTVTFADRLRYRSHRFVFALLYYLSWIPACLNKVIISCLRRKFGIV